jgi:hypothetical protein
VLAIRNQNERLRCVVEGERMKEKLEEFTLRSKGLQMKNIK